MIHPGQRANFVIRLKALGSQVKTLLTADVCDEFGAQLNLTEKPKRKETTPKVMYLPGNCMVRMI